MLNDDETTIDVSTVSAMTKANSMVNAKLKKEAKLRASAPSSDDPRVELRRLVREHRNRMRGAVALGNMGSDKVARMDIPDRGLKKGDKIPCAYPKDVASVMLETAKLARKTAKAWEIPIANQLKHIEIYNTFLKHVYGFGNIVSAYLIAMIDIKHVGEHGREFRPSALRKYCGYAVMQDGRLDHPVPGQKLGYNKELRTQIYNAFQAMRKNSCKETLCEAHKEAKALIGEDEKEAFKAECHKCKDCLKTERPFGITNKYLEIWYNAKHRALLQGMGKGAADSKGRNKATDVFLLDLYTVWRSIERLESYPSYYEHHIGEGHRGWHLLGNQGPQVFTVDAALDLVGDYKAVPLTFERKWGIQIDEVEDSAA